ncbi:MAG TPA: pseudaminic acid cytidylyltransferase [Chitinophagaceae bacterium]|nr:pseudaminic acid cytidylyltransferase [Chitinophagaceae bacterium]
MKSVAIITARGGSKRIPRKNIRNFLGQPIICYSIQAALDSGLFDEIMVSTDDDEIAEIALKAGAAVPFRRSGEASDDYATTAQVLTEVLNEYEKNGKKFDLCCCIYPTAPFVSAQKLKKALQLLTENNADAVIPVVRYATAIQRSLKMTDQHISFNWPEYATTRSQDLPPAFYDCGQFYFFQIAAFRKNKRLFMPHTFGLEVSEMEVQDIDNLDDWKMAEFKYSYIHSHLEPTGLDEKI